MNLVNESVKERGGMMVVPSAYTEGFNQAEKGAKGRRVIEPLAGQERRRDKTHGNRGPTQNGKLCNGAQIAGNRVPQVFAVRFV